MSGEELAPIEKALMDDDETRPIRFHVDGNVLRVSVIANLSSIPEEHHTFASMHAREMLVLDLVRAIQDALEAEGLPRYEVHPGEVEVEY